jgi:lipopolysaccharide biosynthesis protein
MKKSIICHLYNKDLANDLLKRLLIFNDKSTSFFFNIQGNSKAHKEILNIAKNSFPDSYITQCPNKGRDIGAKLTLINLMIRLNVPSDYTLIIHDKKSLHTSGGDRWREELYKVISPSYVNKIFGILGKNSNVGIVGAANYIQNEYDEVSHSFLCNSNQKIKLLLDKYKVSAKDYNFIAGNIFWIRTQLLKDFFIDRSFLEIKAELEEGNMLDFENGTFVHAWERMMSWIATSQGQKIYGI